jgi:hypothetical protein
MHSLVNFGTLKMYNSDNSNSNNSIALSYCILHKNATVVKGQLI